MHTIFVLPMLIVSGNYKIDKKYFNIFLFHCTFNNLSTKFQLVCAIIAGLVLAIVLLKLDFKMVSRSPTPNGYASLPLLSIRSESLEPFVNRFFLFNLLKKININVYKSIALFLNK